MPIPFRNPVHDGPFADPFVMPTADGYLAVGTGSAVDGHIFELLTSPDSTRLVVGNDGWEHVVTDITTVHDYTPDARVLRERYGDAGSVEATITGVQPGYRAILASGVSRAGEPVVLSEFGGLTLDTSDGETWHGYGVVTDAASLLKGYRELVDALLDSPAIAGFCYTQLTDTLQEKNGLVTDDRRPKVEAREVRRINRRTPAAVPGDAAFEPDPAGDG